MLRLDCPIPIQHTLQECSIAWREAKRQVKKILKTSFATRCGESDYTIAALENSLDATDKRKVKVLKQIRRAESIQEMFRKLKFVRNPTRTQGITRIEIPVDPDTDPKQCIQWKEIDVPSEILAQLQERNRKHFGQAAGTPFTVYSLGNHLEFHGDIASGQDILDGNFDTSKLLLAVQSLYGLPRTSTDLRSNNRCRIQRKTSALARININIAFRVAFRTLPSDDRKTRVYRGASRS